MTTITVCMGSSCYSKGNYQNAEIVNECIKKHNLKDTVVVRGSLCTGHCKKGPNIKINDTLFSAISPENIEDVLLQELGLES